MTILVAVKKDGRIFLGADRITTFGSEYVTDLVDGSKIIKLKHGYIATSGYALIDNVVEHLYKSDHKLVENTFNDRSEVFSFFLELYTEMKKTYNLVDSGKETYANFHNVFLLVTARSIFGVASNMTVFEYDRFVSKGAGEDLALGCLYGTYDLLSDGFEITRLALEAACKFSVYCKEPLDIIEVKESDFSGKKGDSYKPHSQRLTTMTYLKGIHPDMKALAPAKSRVLDYSNSGGLHKSAPAAKKKSNSRKAGDATGAKNAKGATQAKARSVKPALKKGRSR